MRAAGRGAVISWAAAALLSLASGTAAASVPRDFYGVVPQAAPDAPEYARMAGGGVDGVRFKIQWPEVQPSSDGGFDWSSTDELVHDAVANGLRPLPVLYGAPRWATGCTGSGCLRIAPVGSQQARAAWADFCREAAARYGPGGEFWSRPENAGLPNQPIRDWQIWNEQNSSGAYLPRASVRGYAKLLKLAADGIRGVDPDADLILGGMFATPGTPNSIYSWIFLRRLYALRGARRNFDVVAPHPYSPNLDGIKLQVRLLRAEMARANDASTPLWVTEIGWASDNSRFDLSKGLRGQARMLRKSFSLFERHRRTWKLRRVFWYSWRDSAQGSGRLANGSGLIRADGRAKPSWSAYRDFAG
jgi:hypothetical protein